MWPWMNQGFSPMYGMGGGFQQYQPQVEPMQYSQGAMKDMQRRDRMEGRVGNLNDRIGALQEQYKGAGSGDQAGIQDRISALQGRATGLQGKLDAGTGANRIGMQYRRERRQMQNAGGYNPQAQMQQPPPFSMFGMGGMGMGGMNFGMPFGGMNYGSMFGNYNPTMGQPQQAPQQPQAAPQQSRAPGGAPPSFYEAGQYNTPYGLLVQSNSGNGNLMKLNNSNDGRQFYFDPTTKSWNVATQDQLNQGNFANPYDYAKDAGAKQVFLPSFSEVRQQLSQPSPKFGRQMTSPEWNKY